MEKKKKVTIHAQIQGGPLTDEEKDKIRDALKGTRIQGLAINAEGLTTDTEPQVLSDMVDMHTQIEDPMRPMA